MAISGTKRRALIALATTGAMVATGLGVSGASTVPSGSKKVSVKAGSTHKKINATLVASGAISGKVTVQGSGKKVTGVTVTAYDDKGQVAGYGFADSNGQYHAYGLETGKYRICVVSPPGPSSAYKFGLSPACIGTSTPPTFFGIPKNAKRFSVHRGHATKANLAMPKAGGIGGTVKSSSGRKLKNVAVQTFQGQQFLRGANTDGHGRYTVTGLRPGKYKVCFVAENEGSITTSIKTGVLPQCWKNVAYSTRNVPSNAKSVAVKAGKMRGGINARMRTAGAIAGKVVAAGNHKPLTSSSVEAFQGTKFYASTFTNKKGKYTLKDLPAGNYKVCAIGGAQTGNVGATGGRCYVDSPLKHFGPTSSAKSVSVKIGKTHKNVNMKLPTRKFVSGSISGKLTGPGGVGISGANVEAEGGLSGSSASTASDGTYTINGLVAGKYTVCFDPGTFAQPSTGTAPATGYSKVCYKNAKWAGASSKPAAGAAKVKVKANKTTKHVNAKVGKGGAIAGTVKLAGGGSDFIGVEVLDSKGFQASGTETDGDYTVIGLTPSSSGYFVCFSASSANFSPPNHLGYIDQCYKNKTWSPPVFGALPGPGPRAKAQLPLNLRTAQSQVPRR